MQTDSIDVKERIQASIDYIEANLDKKIKLEELAGKACYSIFHFHRIFKQIVGQTAMDYLRKRRLAMAAQELKDAKEAIVDIALKYQFYSQESFTRAFTGEYGISPARFRKSVKDLSLPQRINMFEKAMQRNSPQINGVLRAA